MLRYVRIAVGLVVCLVCVPIVVGQTALEPKKVRVELRWVESKRVESLTEDVGFQCSCDPDDVVYPHKKPALVLTAAEVAEAHLTSHDLANSTFYLVTLHLTKEAREKLAATCEGKKARLLTVVVDGKYWGVRRYEKDKDKPFVPKVARAETFTPSVGFFSSMAEAERLMTALE